jgi:SAM-dependent methyltransferase
MRDLKDYQNHYSEQSFEDKVVFYRHRQVLMTIDKYPSKRILDIGCALDPLFKYVKDYERIVVLEPASLFLEKAREMLKELDLKNIDVYGEYFEDSYDLLKDEKFDLIVASSLLHEVEDPDSFMKMMVSLVDNTETVVHINVPNAKSIHRLLGVEMGVIKSGSSKSELGKKFQVTNVFDIDSLSKLVGEYGFEVVESGSYLVKPFSHNQMQAMCEAGIIDDEVIAGLDAIATYFPENGSEIFVNLRKTG